MHQAHWIYTTWPDETMAQAAGRALVEAGLCACVNILPGMTSLYRWKDGIETDREAVMILKTAADRTEALKSAFLALHPYDEPCFLALPIEILESAAGYVDWLISETRPKA